MEFSQEELEMVGKDPSRLTENEKLVPDYECAPQSIADAIGQIRRGANWRQTAFMYNILNNCDVMPIGAGDIQLEVGDQKRIAPPNKNGKKKKAMSGYNCFMKECAKSKPFPDCLTEGKWKGMSDSDKARYNEMAKGGCNI